MFRLEGARSSAGWPSVAVLDMDMLPRRAPCSTMLHLLGCSKGNRCSNVAHHDAILQVDLFSHGPNGCTYTAHSFRKQRARRIKDRRAILKSNMIASHVALALLVSLLVMTGNASGVITFIAGEPLTAMDLARPKVLCSERICGTRKLALL